MYMGVIKESSTNNRNRQKTLAKCPVTFTIGKIGGRWKPLILWHLTGGKKRYNELRKSIPDITEKMLIQHLRELEADLLVKRVSQPVVPPFVEYSLTGAGREIGPVLEAMAKWGMKNNK
jgi:DNA-binding HxlR family transcriptional regulator